MAAPPSKRQIVWSFVRNVLVGGRPRAASGIRVYDALQVAPALEWTEAGYLNFGLWHDGIASTNEASEALLACVADRAGLADAARVLDVGFGTGAQTVFLAGLTSAQIVGVNHSASQTALAKVRVTEAGLGDRVALQRGDATALDLPDAGFDVVTCVEAAFHFDPRERFLREAHRVLAPGGRLVLADILCGAPPHWSHGLFWGLFHRLFFVPKVNRIGIEAYREQLKAAGFDAHIEVVTERVYIPFFENRVSEYDWWAAIALCRLLVRWFRWRSPCDYVIAVATR